MWSQPNELLGKKASIKPPKKKRSKKKRKVEEECLRSPNSIIFEKETMSFDSRKSDRDVVAAEKVDFYDKTAFGTASDLHNDQGLAVDFASVLVSPVVVQDKSEVPGKEATVEVNTEDFKACDSEVSLNEAAEKVIGFKTIVTAGLTFTEADVHMLEKVSHINLHADTRANGNGIEVPSSPTIDNLANCRPKIFLSTNRKAQKFPVIEVNRDPLRRKLERIVDKLTPTSPILMFQRSVLTPFIASPTPFMSFKARRDKAGYEIFASATSLQSSPRSSCSVPEASL
jgi:hypothetical protein